MRKLLMKASDTEDPNDQTQKEIDFAWALVDWRTFDPISPMQAFPGKCFCHSVADIKLTTDI